VLDLDYYGAFPRRLKELGYVEGVNLHIEWRFANGDYKLLPGMASELVRLKMDAIMALGPPCASAAQKVTTTIPIVIVVSVDPVAAGFVKSLARPGGNITGLSNLGGDISAKHLEMLLAMVPGLSRVAVLVNPGNPAHAQIVKNIQAAAQKVSIKSTPLNAQTPEEIESALAAATNFALARACSPRLLVIATWRLTAVKRLLPQGFPMRPRYISCRLRGPRLLRRGRA